MEIVSEYVFPAIRGIQAEREYYVAMCPLRLIPKLFLFDEEELIPEVRAQRTLNRTRVPEIARYILENRRDYVFSALTASIDADVRFQPLGSGRDADRMGLLRIPLAAKFVINDGQHRRAAIQMALREHSDLGDETIAVVFFLDIGLERSQQMFADLNRYAVRPSRSLSVLYDHRDDKARLAKLVVYRSPVFRDLVEMERSSLSARSRRLFTLSAVCSATAALVSHVRDTDFDGVAEIAMAFWGEVDRHIPHWKAVREGRLTAAEIRQDYIHCHAVGLRAIATAGGELLQLEPDDWAKRLAPLSGLDWSRSNASLWEGRALSGGRIINSGRSLTLTSNAVKQRLGLPLNPDEQCVEEALAKGGVNE